MSIEKIIRVSITSKDYKLLQSYMRDRGVLTDLLDSDVLVSDFIHYQLNLYFLQLCNCGYSHAKEVIK